MKTDKEKQEMVQAQTETQLSLSSLLEEQLSSVTVTGFENVTADDLGLTIISVLQKSSPQVDKTQPEYTEGLEAGEFFNSVTKKSYKTLKVIPVGFSKAYIEWVPKTAGGGFVGKHKVNSAPVLSAMKVGSSTLTENGNELVETAEHYVLVIPDDGAPYIALLPLKSSQLKHSKRWLTEMMGKTAGTNRLPSYFQMYELSTGVEQNSKGTWYGLTKISYMGPVPDTLLQEAKNAAEQFEATLNKSEAAYAKQAGVDSSKDAAADQIIDAMV